MYIEIHTSKKYRYFNIRYCFYLRKLVKLFIEIHCVKYTGMLQCIVIRFHITIILSDKLKDWYNLIVPVSELQITE